MMGARELDGRDGINHYWDMVASGAPRTGDDVDPLIARQIDGLHAHQVQSGADPAFLQRLRGELIAAPALRIASMQRGAEGGRTPVNGRSSMFARPGRHWPIPSVAVGWRSVRLAVALLLIAALIAGGSAYRQERHGARLAAVVGGVPTTDLYMTVFDELEGPTGPRWIKLDPITLGDRPQRDAMPLAVMGVFSSDGHHR